VSGESGTPPGEAPRPGARWPVEPAAPPAEPAAPPAEPLVGESPAADPPPPAGRRQRPWVRPALRVAQIVLVAAIVYFLAAYLVRSWSTVKDYHWSLRPGWLVLSGLVFLAFYVSQAVAWWLLLRGFGLHSPFPVAMSTWGKSILARYVPGNVFMFVGRAWMSHGQGLPVDTVSAAMVYEQALGVCSALVAVAVLFPFWEYDRGVTALSLIAIPLFIVLLHPRVFRPLSSWALRLLHRRPLDVTLGFGAVIALLWYYVAAWMMAGTGAWLLARAVTGLGVGSLPLVIVAYALSFVVGMAAFIFPSGIGVREAVLTASLSRQLPGGVALAWALLLRLWVTAMELLFVGLAVAAERLVYRRKGAS
jgi:glycosyltransferase 2 family protein